jgi:tyrosine-protein kinase Etk/Wzc
MIEMRSEMNQIRDNLAEEARKIAEAQNVIDPLSQMAQLYERKINLELDLETVRAQERSLAGEIGRYDGNLRQLPGKEYELARLTRERDLASDIYIMLSNRWEEARINEAEKVGNLRIIDRAELPKRPISPRKRLNLAIGFIFGMTMGLGLAFFLESLDTSIKTPEEVERKTGLTIIGSIPRIRMSKSKKDSRERRYQSLSEMLITYSMPGSPASEAYRTLRTNLQFSDMADDLRTFMISSSGPKEGKSTTISNLAITTAQMGLRTLLIDADLRRPTIHQIFSLQREPGLADILMHFYKSDDVPINSGQDELREEMAVGAGGHVRQASVRARKTVQQIASLDLAITAAVQPTPTEKLEVLTCGVLPPNPSEVLASETMRDLLALVRERYEIVVIDAPPIIAVTDAAVLAPQVDGVALVIESGRNDKEIIQKAKGLLERVGVNVIGAILNNVQEKNLYGDYDYYYTYYAKDSS